MTAAVLRPGLFTHLFATQRRNPDKGDFAASAISIVLHGSIVAALVWASTRIETVTDSVVEKTTPIYIASPDPMPEPIRPSGGGGGGGDPSQRLPIAVPLDLQNLQDPRDLPVDTTPWSEPIEEPGTPGPPASNPDNPPGTGSDGTAMRDGIAVISVIPKMLNTRQVQHALENNYPAILRDSGVGGRVVLWLLIDENGRVADAEVKEGSGHEMFDKAAVKVGEMMRFSPAMNQNTRVKVWVALPIVFKTR